MLVFLVSVFALFGRFRGMDGCGVTVNKGKLIIIEYVLLVLPSGYRMYSRSPHWNNDSPNHSIDIRSLHHPFIPRPHQVARSRGCVTPGGKSVGGWGGM